MHSYSKGKHLKHLTLGILACLFATSQSVMAADPTPITGEDSDTYYTTENIRNSDGTYTFTKDFEIKTTEDSTSPLNIKKKLTLKAEGYTLTFNHDYDSQKIGAAFKHEKIGDPITLTAKTFKIINKNTQTGADKSASSIGIWAKKNLTLNGALDIYTEGAKSSKGIFVEGKDAKVTINGTVKASDRLTSIVLD